MPKNWESDVRYARSLDWSEEFPCDVRSQYNTEYTMSELVDMQHLPVHCLRSKYTIPAGAFLGEVTGTVVKKDELENYDEVMAIYLCSIPRLGELFVDLTRNSNEARLVIKE